MNARCGRQAGLVTPNRLHGIVLQPWWLATTPLLALSACSPQPATTRPLQTGEPVACPTGQLSLRLDDGNGRFNGMSHAGTTLVVQNAGKVACSIVAMPSPRLRDAQRQTLAIAPQTPTTTRRSTAAAHAGSRSERGKRHALGFRQRL